MTEIKQEDRDAAERFNIDLSAHLTGTQLHNLAGILAKHRQSAEDRMKERAAAECEAQQQAFLSPEYATSQPLSSFQERFACGQCAEAIRNLK